MLIELKSGETYNGHLVACDTWMNLHLREVILTSREGELRAQQSLPRAPPPARARAPRPADARPRSPAVLHRHWSCPACERLTRPARARAHAPFSLCLSLSLARARARPPARPSPGDKFWRLPEAYVRGNMIKYLRVPDEVLDMVKDEPKRDFGGRGGGRGRGRGRGNDGGRGGRGRGGRGGGRGGDGGGRGRGRGRQ